MRTIGYPRVTAIDDAIEIIADDKNEKNGNASHHYYVRIPPKKDKGGIVADIHFQDGPINEVGVNGVGQEAILAILIDRLQCFQSSKYSCKENAVALTHLEEALNMLNSRTLKRKMYGVEGTHELCAVEAK